MNDAQTAGLAQLESLVGQVISRSLWVEIDQERVNSFADISGDHQWIHVDIERAKSGQYGNTIVHGNLTLSMLGHLPLEFEHLPNQLEGQVMGLNYGYNRIRFPAPLIVGSTIRVTSTLQRVEVKGHMLETMTEAVAEVEGGEKPVCVAERLRRWVF